MIPDNFKTHKSAWRTAIKGMIAQSDSEDDLSYWEHELRAYDEAHAELEAASTDIWNGYVAEMKTSAGTDYYVMIDRHSDKDVPFFDRHYVSPSMHRQRGIAEYEVAFWDAFLNGKPMPDPLMALGLEDAA